MKHLALLVLAVFASGCASTLPEPRPDVDAALAVLRSSELSGGEPIESELIERAWGRGPDESAHEVVLLHTGSDALTARAHLIRAARESIDIQVFAWEPDEAGAFLFELLDEATLRGVRVRLLVDQMANAGRSGLGRICARHVNLQLRVYNPVGRRSSISRGDFLRESTSHLWRINQRMHNKVMVVDGRVAIIGGRNIAECYFDMDPEFCYLDRDALVIGPAAADAQESFESYWEWSRTLDAAYLDDVAEDLLEWAAGEGVPVWEPDPLPRYDWARELSGHALAAEAMPHSRLHGVERIDFFADGPGKRASEEEGAHLALDEHEEKRAQRYVLIQSNYLVLAQDRIRSLKVRTRERPELVVSYLTNSLAATANTMVYGVSRKQRSRILGLGLEVYEMRPVPGDVRHLLPRYDELLAEDRRLGEGDTPYADLLANDVALGPQLAIHAKSVVVDGELAIVSSHNLDPRSDELNTESGLMIWDTAVAAELESELRLIMGDANSWRSASKRRVPVLSFLNDIVTNISRALPVLDVWPVRDYSNYELREGVEPVSPRDASFHGHYRKAGQFPEVTSSKKRWATRFFSCFGGLIKGLL